MCGEKAVLMNRNDDLILFFIVIVALTVRGLDIQQPLVDVFSWRQASTAMMADNFQSHSWNIFYPEVSWTGTDPGYQGRELAIVPYLTAMLFTVAGWHDWLGRLVAIGFSVLTVVAIHRLVHRVWGVMPAHAAALIYGLLPGAVLIDRSFLPDPAMLALVTAGIWLFIKYLDEGSGYLLPLSTALFTLGVLTKLPGIAAALPIVYAMTCWFVSGGKSQTGRIVTLAAASLISLAAAASYYAWAIHLGNTYPPYHVAGSGYIWTDGLESFTKAYFYLPNAWKSAVNWYATAPILFLAGVGLLTGPPQTGAEDRLRFRWLFHVWMAGGVIVYLAAAREISVNIWNFHIYSVPIAVFAGRGLLALVRTLEPAVNRSWQPVRFAAILATVVGLGLLPALSLFKTPWAYSGYALGQALSSLSQPGDYVIAISTEVGDPVAIYYSRRRGWVFPPGGGQTDWSAFVDNEQAIAQLETLKSSGAKWFGVARDAKDSKGRLFFQHHDPLVKYLDQTARRVVDTKDFVIYRL